MKLKPKATETFLFEAIGTAWTIELYNVRLNPSLKAHILKAIRNRIKRFDANYSRFREDSLVTRMSQVAGEYLLPADAKPLLDLYQEMYVLSNGAVTPLIGNLLSDAGYDANYSLQPQTLTQPDTWQECLVYTFPKLTIKKPVLLDFGAAGKGYLIDLLGEVLEKQGIRSYLIDAGGDMKYQSSEPKIIGLENPDSITQVIGTVPLVNQSLCGSAGNRRAWSNFHHIMHPVTLTSVQHIKAAWATADSTILADAMTTCLFFVDATELKKRYNFEYALMREDNSLEYSTDFPAIFFTDDK